MVIIQNTLVEVINQAIMKFRAKYWHKRPNLYVSNIHNSFIVVVQCPHCVEDIELENNSFGLFECPYCSGEFEYEPEYEPVNEPIIEDLIPESNYNLSFKFGMGFLFFSALLLTFGVISISNTPDDFDNTKRTCNEPLWFDNWAGDRGCSTEGDYGAGSACGGIFMVLAGFCFLLASILSITIGSSNSKKVVLVQK